MSFSETFASVVAFLVLLQGAWGLRGVKVSVPEAVRLGQPAILTCQFQLDGEALYTVKWYKSGREFYRFTPKETPTTKVFPMPGLSGDEVAKDKSNSTHLVLKNTTSGMSGQYSCEVSADAPSFHTATVSGHLRVVDPPGGRPTVTGLKSRYKLGEVIQANCTSPGSKPAANLTWVINGKTPETRRIKNYREVLSDDLEKSTSSIRLHANEGLFANGRMKLKCTASVLNVYWQTTEKVAELDRPKESYKEPDIRTPPPPTNELIHQDLKNTGLDLHSTQLLNLYAVILLPLVSL